ncbi:MAG: hypothetical protein II697_06820, partial [Clostridia bacterium]|nr:hypothetical protein [Clostridia bacterium]
MKRTIVALLLVLALSLGLCLSNAEEQATAPQPTLLMTIDDAEVWLSDIQNIAYQLYMYGYAESMYDYLQALDYWLMSSVAAQVLAGPKAEELLKDSYAQLKQDYETEFDSYVEEYAQSLFEEGDSEETKAAKRQQAIAEYAAEGLERDSYTYRSLALDAMEVLLADVIAQPTDEDIQALYDEYVATHKSYFENNVALYEYYTMMNGYDSYYVPAGYRSVLHILLDVEEELKTAYTSAAPEEKEAAGQAMIDANREKLDAIYLALEEGAQFQDLIAQYNTDPGMKDEATLQEGYPVHSQSAVYAQEFTDGAFSSEMQKPGDVSKPIPSQ